MWTDGAELRAVTLGRSTLVPTCHNFEPSRAPSLLFLSLSPKKVAHKYNFEPSRLRNTNAPFCKKLAGPDRSRSRTWFCEYR